MDYIPCKTPEMVQKFLSMHLLAYNLVRLLMAEAAIRHSARLERISFKETLDAVRHWAPLIALQGSSRRAASMYGELLRCISNCIVPERPGRREPRAVKRRDKGYDFLNKSRHRFRERTEREKTKQRQGKVATLT
jgi:hypothetical protein